MQRNEFVESLLQQCNSHCPTVENNTCDNRSNTWLPRDEDDNSGTSSVGGIDTDSAGFIIGAVILLAIIGFACGMYTPTNAGFMKLNNDNNVEMGTLGERFDEGEEQINPVHKNSNNNNQHNQHNKHNNANASIINAQSHNFRTNTLKQQQQQNNNTEMDDEDEEFENFMQL